MSQRVTTETIELTSQAALPGILACLSVSQTGRVLLVVPPELSLGAIDLRVLRREAASARVGVALVTSDPGLRTLAGREGISTFRSRDRAERSRWHRFAVQRPSREHPGTPSESTVPPAAGLFDRRSPTGFRPVGFVRAAVPRQSPWWAVLGLAVSLLAIFGGLLYALILIIPSATITLAPASDPFQVVVPVQAVQDGVLDAEAGIVPAQTLSVQVAGEARTQTTGRSNEPTGKAKGRVVLINRSGREITVPSGTVVSTGTGNNVSFVTLADLSLVPNGRAPVPVEATQPGPGGNVRAGTVTRVEGALALSLLVANEANFSGGTTAQVGVVTEDDKTRLQAQLLEELKKQALERLNERVKGERFIPPGSVTFLPLSPTFTPFVGEVSPDLYLSMSVQAVGLAADTRAANQVVLAQLQRAMPPGTRLISETLRYISGPVVLDDARTLSFSVTGEGTLLRGVDSTAVRSAVLGLSPEDAAQLLMTRFALAGPPVIQLGPDWLPYVDPRQAACVALAHPGHRGLGYGGAVGDAEMTALVFSV